MAGNGNTGRLHNYLTFLKVDKKLLAVCIFSLLVPITLSGIYFLSGFVRLTRENELRQAQNNVDRFENQLHEILGKAIEIANRVYVNPQIQQIVSTEYESLLDIYNDYSAFYLFDDYMRSYKEIAGIRLYVENPTMIDNSYFIVADDSTRRENWYESAITLDGRMFWIYRHDAIHRTEYISLVRQIRNNVSGSFLGILCVNLDMGHLEQLCAAELYNTIISFNDELVCPDLPDEPDLQSSANWIITNTFTPQQTQDSLFTITCIIPRKALYAPVYTMMRKGIAIILVSLAIALIFIIQIINKVYVEKLQKEKLFSRQKEMQLKMLTNQINPHFLYNTLETIRMMAMKKNENEIAITIKMLSGLLRQSMGVSDKTVTLDKEIELVRNYLTIQKLRFSSRMNYTITMKPELGACSILPFLIQPLVENSLIHGLEVKPGGGQIWISIEIKSNMLSIEVSDNGRGMKPEKLEELQNGLASGEDYTDDKIGLYNVNRRIKLFYGQGYGLSINERAGNGITVSMLLPQ